MGAVPNSPCSDVIHVEIKAFPNSTQDLAQKQPARPHETMPAWKLKVTIGVNLAMVLMNEYDVSNTANIQASIYEALGGMEYLPWVGLGYSAGVTATMPIFRRLSYIIDMKVLMLLSCAVFLVGVVVAGSANSIEALIVGRILNGVGGAGITQMVFSYITLLSGPRAPQIIGIMGMLWALGLVAGPLVGGALANTEHATWRWSIYLALPLLGINITAVILCFPSYTVRNATTTSLLSELRKMDWLGAILHIGSVMLLLLALTFSGAVFPWSSGSDITLWVVWAVVFVLYALQQAFCVFTTPARRIFPVNMLGHRVVGLCALGTAIAGIAYSTALYYLPLFFAFTRGLGPVASAVRLLPYIGVFIVVITAGGVVLPALGRYVLFYLASGLLILAGGALLTTLVDINTASGTVMGLSVLLAAGVGLVYQHGITIANAALPPELKIDGNAIMGMAQTAGAALGLAIAGCIYQNKAFALLKDAIGPMGYTDQDIRQALAGLKSPIWTTADVEVETMAIDALSKGICMVFYTIVGAGVVGCIGALTMRWEKLEFKKPAPGARQVQVSDKGEGENLELEATTTIATSERAFNSNA